MTIDEPTPIKPDEEPQSAAESEPAEEGTFYIDGDNDGVIAGTVTRPTGFQR